MSLAVKHFEVNIATSKKVVMRSDHNPLAFLAKLRIANSRLFHWSLVLQLYNPEIKHIAGKNYDVEEKAQE